MGPGPSALSATAFSEAVTAGHTVQGEGQPGGAQLQLSLPSSQSSIPTGGRAHGHTLAPGMEVQGPWDREGAELEAISPAQPGPVPRWVILGGRCAQEPDPFLWFWAGYMTLYPPHLPWLHTSQERPWSTPSPLRVEGVKLSPPQAIGAPTARTWALGSALGALGLAFLNSL